MIFPILSFWIGEMRMTEIVDLLVPSNPSSMFDNNLAVRSEAG